MSEDIKPGYLLKITTWENDGDSYATKDIQGLSVDHVNFYIEVAEKFYSCHSYGRNPDDRTYGNSDTDTESTEGQRYARANSHFLVADIQLIVDNYLAANHSVPEEFDYTKFKYYDGRPGDTTLFADGIVDSLYELIGVWADGEYWRVFDKFEVFLVQAPIQNVTANFK